MKKYYISFFILLVVALNFAAIVDKFFHPEIPYFDKEHLFVGGFFAITIAFFMYILLAFIRRDENNMRQKEHAESSLRPSEEIYRSIVEDQSEFICRFNPDWTFTFVNNAYFRYLGKKQEEMLGDKFIQIVYEDDRDVLIKKFASLNRDNPSITCEYRIVMPATSDVRWHRWTHRGIYGNDGNLVEYQSVGQDISEQKTALARLEEAHKLFIQIFRQNEDALLLLRPETYEIVDVNKTAKDLFGYDKSEFSNYFRQNYQTLINHIKDFNGTPLERSTLSPCIVEDTLIDRYGNIKTISCRLQNIKMDGKDIIFCSIRDITQKVKTEEDAKTIESKLLKANKMAALGALTSSIAHEINNPNNFIMFNIPLLIDVWQDAIPILEEYYENHGDSYQRHRR
jgi:PAS domain S-box-containing protein